MSINVTDANETWYGVARIAKNDGLEKACKAALEAGLSEEEFVRIASNIARSMYVFERAKKARDEARRQLGDE